MAADRSRWLLRVDENGETSVVSGPTSPPQQVLVMPVHEHEAALRVAEPPAECYSCGEGLPEDDCPRSKRGCGHHCNCSWVHGCCHWCGREFGDQIASVREEVAAISRCDVVNGAGLAERLTPLLEERG